VVGRELRIVPPEFAKGLVTTLLLREGHLINRKRTERLYREEGLSLWLKRRKKRISHLRVVMDRPERINQHWSMDFVSDSLYKADVFAFRPSSMISVVNARHGKPIIP
jgi:putative transposase